MGNFCGEDGTWSQFFDPPVAAIMVGEEVGQWDGM
jgi:hypothetical protein